MSEVFHRVKIFGEGAADQTNMARCWESLLRAVHWWCMPQLGTKYKRMNLIIWLNRFVSIN